MQTAIIITQILIALFLVFLILIQPGGAGFGKSSMGKSSFTRRGLEKLTFKTTFIASAIFIILSISQLFI